MVSTGEQIKTVFRVSLLRRLTDWVRYTAHHMCMQRKNLLSRRPHRTLRRTRRRDYVRSLQMPGYISFTMYVQRVIWSHWRTFLLLVVVCAIGMIFIGGVTSQGTYTQINTLLKSSGSNLFGSGIGKIGQAGLIAASAILTGPNSLSADQQIYLFIGLLFAWLCTVWLLREYLLNRKPNLRDGLYNSGAPIISTLVVLFVLVVQLLPVGVVALIYAGLASVGLLDGGFGNMIFWMLVVAVSCLVLYWITSTIIALVVVTLPGMYPMHAIRAAGDLVIGRRLRILLRLLWGSACIVMAWMVVMIPAILLDTATKAAWPALQSVPFMPYLGALMAAGSMVWYSAYVYLLYRKVVDDDAKPA